MLKLTLLIRNILKNEFRFMFFLLNLHLLQSGYRLPIVLLKQVRLIVQKWFWVTVAECNDLLFCYIVWRPDSSAVLAIPCFCFFSYWGRSFSATRTSAVFAAASFFVKKLVQLDDSLCIQLFLLILEDFFFNEYTSRFPITTKPSANSSISSSIVVIATERWNE